MFQKWKGRIGRKLGPLDSGRALQFFNFSRFGANFLSGWLLVKAGMPISEVSLYETLLFLGNLFTFFWHGGGQNALLGYFPKLTDVQREKLLFNVFLVFLLFSLLSAGALWVSGAFIARRFQQGEGLPHLSWFCVFLVLNTPAFLVHIFFLLRGEPGKIVRYAAWSFSLQVLVVGAPAFLGLGLRPVFMGLVALALLRLASTLAVLRRRSVFAVDFILIRNWAVSWLPLSLHLLVGNSMEYIDGWIVSSFFADEGTFAVFRYGARELPLVSLAVGALVTASIPALAGNAMTGGQYLRNQTLRLSRWVYPLSMALVFLSPLLYPWVYNDQFRESAWLFNIYLLIVPFRMLLPQVILIGSERHYFLVFSAVLETALNVTLSLWWVEYYGLWGIAAATVVANAFNKGALIVYCWLKLGIGPSSYIPWKPMLIYDLALGLSFYFSYLIFYS